MKGIIKCPVCFNRGIKSNLAQIMTSEFISVQRIRKGARDKRYKNYTIIGGKNLYLICGECGTKVFSRNISRNTSRNK